MTELLNWIEMCYTIYPYYNIYLFTPNSFHFLLLHLYLTSAPFSQLVTTSLFSLFLVYSYSSGVSLMAQMVKTLHAMPETWVCIPALGRAPSGGHGNPLQYSCLENPHEQKCLAGHSPWGHKVLVFSICESVCVLLIYIFDFYFLDFT